jgi:hypothetical protein
MPRHQRPQTAPPPPPPAGLTPEQVDRWAAPIADGRDAFPDDLPPDDRDRLLLAVRERLRSQLVRLIARAIAAQLRRRPDTENPTDA